VICIWYAKSARRVVSSAKFALAPSDSVLARGRECAHDMPKPAANLQLIHFLGRSAALLRQNSPAGSAPRRLKAGNRVASGAIQINAYILSKKNIF
jgi:hypothetical protein